MIILKVLLVHPRIYQGGAEQIVWRLAYHLAEKGHDSKIVTLSVDLNGMPPEARHVSYSVPTPSRWQRFNDMIEREVGPNLATDLLSSTLKLGSVIRREAPDFDIINAHNYPSPWAAVTSRIKQPILWSCNEPYFVYLGAQRFPGMVPRIYFRAYSMVQRAFDTILVTRGISSVSVFSEKIQRYVKAYYGLSAHVIRPPIDPLFFNSHDRQQARNQLGIDDEFLVLQVGWFVPQKNQAATVDALHLLSKEIPSAKLALVGGGHYKHALYRAYLRSKVRQLGLDRKVLFIENVTGADAIGRLYAAADCVVFPSLEQSWGLVPFEALASGRLPIVSDECGAAEIIGPIQAGIVVKPEPAHIANAIREYYRKPEIFVERLEKGRSFVKENMTWESYVTRMIKVFELSLRNGTK